MQSSRQTQAIATCLETLYEVLERATKETGDAVTYLENGEGHAALGTATVIEGLLDHANALVRTAIKLHHLKIGRKS